MRCFSCGKVVGDKWEPFVRRVAAGESPKAVLDDLGLDRYCCRRMLISHVDIIDEILKYYEIKHANLIHQSSNEQFERKREKHSLKT